MLKSFSKYFDRLKYRISSFILIFIAVAIPLFFSVLFEWKAFAIIVGLPFYVALIFITYARFINASISPFCIIPMVLAFRFGPQWEIGHINFYLSGLISLFPVLIGWFAREQSDQRDVPQHNAAPDSEFT